MKASDIMHPEDAKAIQVLRRLKGFDEIVRISMQYGYEQIYRGINLGNLVKVNAHNLPNLYLAFKNVVKRVGIKEPELYIYNDPEMNAYTYGETNPFIAISSSLVEKMTIDEVSCIIAHECGHILCKHTLYNTLLRTITELGNLFELISAATFGPILVTMYYWHRKSELSADRCAAAVVGERTYQMAMLKLACGISDIKGSPYQLVEQARAYHRFEKDSWWNRIQQNCRVTFYSHPQMVNRAWEIDRWKNSWQYKELRNSIC
ncbi:MAG: M48 family metallopeptidase [Prevotella sp.]|nr:M48 family metallopeptidase [Prevotella sp.]